MQHEIVEGISKNYSLEIKSINLFRGIYIINTSEGKKMIKNPNFSTGRILFIHGVKEHLYRNGFKNLDRYICSKEGLPYFSFNGNKYTISEIIEGRECNFESKDDIKKATNTLAYLHKASRGYIATQNCTPRDNLGNIPTYFKKRLDELKKAGKRALKGKRKFEHLLTKHIEYFYNLGEETLNAINATNYLGLVKQSRKEGIICHHDYNHNNVILKENDVSVLNFESCCYELKVYDIANLLRRKMRKCNWDIYEAKMIVDEYSKIESISKDEFCILKIMLKFPQKFWRIVNKYYNTKHNWGENSFTDKLQEVIDEVPHNKRFIEKFEMLTE